MKSNTSFRVESLIYQTRCHLKKRLVGNKKLQQNWRKKRKQPCGEVEAEFLIYASLG